MKVATTGIETEGQVATEIEAVIVAVIVGETVITVAVAAEEETTEDN
jgi:hypothetical protein